MPAAGAAIMAGMRTDTLRLEVAPEPEEVGSGFQVLVYLNGVEMTEPGAGLGMDPYDLLVPANRLVATQEARTVPIARCSCGVYGCGSDDVAVVRDGDLVRWTWLPRVPGNRRGVFAADAYDAEVARVAADHSWETPERTAGRLVLANADRAALRAHGLELDRVGNDHRDPATFRISLLLGSDFQIFVGVPWRDRPSPELAAEVCATLATPPGRWRAEWHAIRPDRPGPPDIARRSWRPFVR